MDKKVYFDVGANDGSAGLEFAGNPEWVVYAFEPTPELAETIRQRTAGFDNYHLIEKAVSDWPGRAIFNVAGQGDWGTSSLLAFADNIEETWAGRADFAVTQQIEVEVIRLEDFCRKNGIDRIDHLHSDVQGLDMEVLLGLGEMIANVRGGDLECSRSHDVALYKGERFVFEDVALLLYQSGFVIDAIKANDDHGQLCGPTSRLRDANELSIWYRRP
ncbi:FkbM family methyltransferase [Brevundimonas diminuta]|uniref:FkbM family methyltransferase n=1 Tax=Brevundimonas diminuta TaxID=293 RepID=UPI000627489C|nr:FkbM family methyltransferase [Brevundimonas diminuta]